MGVWLGEVPEVWSTMLLPRMGVGLTASWRSRRIRLDAMTEVLWGTAGVERGALWVDVRAQPARGTEVGGRLEIEALPGGGPPRLVEGTVSVHGLPAPRLRVHGFYAFLGTRAALRTAARCWS